MSNNTGDRAEELATLVDTDVFKDLILEIKQTRIERIEAMDSVSKVLIEGYKLNPLYQKLGELISAVFISEFSMKYKIGQIFVDNNDDGCIYKTYRKIFKIIKDESLLYEIAFIHHKEEYPHTDFISAGHIHKDGLERNCYTLVDKVPTKDGKEFNWETGRYE